MNRIFWGNFLPDEQSSLVDHGIIFEVVSFKYDISIIVTFLAKLVEHAFTVKK